MNIHKSAVSLLLSIGLVCSIFSLDTTCALAAAKDSKNIDSGSPVIRLGVAIDAPTTLYLDSGNIVFDGENVTQDGQPVTRGTQDSGYLITQENSDVATQNTITVKNGIQEITIQNVNINVSGMDNACAFSIAKGAVVNLTLKGTNTLKSGQDSAGLQVPGDGSDPPVPANSASLTVTDASTGLLTATGGYESAGIGGNNRNICGTVEISGGTVTATGGFDGAGIGGGGNGRGGNITINGGNVTATGKGAGAGIGGGFLNGAGKIFIHGGVITATGGGNGGGGGAGIGSGGWGSEGKVMIDGGTVTAIGKNGGAGIGGGQRCYGYGGCGCDVSITGSNTQVKVQGSGGYDIGSGQNASVGGTLSVSDGATVTMLNTDPNLNTNAVNPDTQSAPPKYRNCQIIIGGTEKEYDGSGNAIVTKPALFLDDGDIVITETGYSVNNGTEVSHVGSYLITQNGNGDVRHSITVQNGTQNITLQNVHAKPAHGAAFEVDGGAEADITLVGSNSLDTSGSSSLRAGLAINAGNTVHISGSGSLTATGKVGSAGIGGNYLCSCGTVKISGGTVTANGCLGGAGIGGGQNCAGGDITISGGTVTATGNYGAGVGGGSCGAGGDVTICGSNTEVVAKGQNGGKDIGSGENNSNGGNLTVGDSNTAEPLPMLELRSAGTNAANPGTGRPQFLDCVIQDEGAKNASGKDISGCYDKNGKLWLDITMQTPSTVKVGESVALSASIKRHYFNDTVTLPGTVQFTAGVSLLGSSPVTNGTAQTNWTPTNGNEVWLKAAYIPAANDCYGSAESTPFDYTPGKMIPTVSDLPTASAVLSGSKLSSSALTGGEMLGLNDAAVPGKFEWASPDTEVTVSGDYEAVFTPADTTVYNAVAGITVPLTVTAAPSPGSHSSGTSTPSLPSLLTDATTHTTVGLSGVTFPSWVTGVSVSAIPETASGVLTGTSGSAADPQGAAVYKLAAADTALHIIGTPILYDIKLFDQNGKSASFTGSATVRIPLPSGLLGTPRVFRYEESTGTFTDMHAGVENGYLVFATEHFSDYLVAGTGSTITLDTTSYQMPVGSTYHIGVQLRGTAPAAVKVYSTNPKAVSAVRMKNGIVQVKGTGLGTAYIMFDVYDNKNKKVSHVSTCVTVRTGIRSRGDSTRQIGVF